MRDNACGGGTLKMRDNACEGGTYSLIQHVQANYRKGRADRWNL